MAYENINVTKLNSSLSKIDNISSNKIASLSNSLSSSEWGSVSRQRIKTALDKIVKEYAEIIKDINNFKSASNYIKQYKNLDGEISDYQEKITYYKRLLNTYNSETTANLKAQTEQKIKKYQNKVSSTATQKKELKKIIDNLIK